MANDILLDDNNDLIILGGDFAVGESTPQEVEAIIISFPGWWNQYPNVGCGLMNYLNGPDAEKLSRDARVHLQTDGKEMTSFDYSFDANGNRVCSFCEEK